MGRIISGAVLFAVGLGIGYWVSWNIDFDTPINWIWVFLLILGIILIIQGLYKMATAIGMALIVTGILWGSRTGYALDPSMSFSQVGWIYFSIAGSIILVLKYLLHTLVSKKWMGKKRREREETHIEHECPPNTYYDEEYGACVYPTEYRFE